MIGGTPVVEFKNLDTGPCRLFGKLEQYNPGGSIKDRIAMTMVEGAEREEKIKPGGTLVEATSGNTGVGLALVAALKGYRMVIVIPDKMSQEKIQHLRAFGAEVIVTRSDVPPGHPENYQTMARRIADETENAFYVYQHGNVHNPRAHEKGTGPEIWAQMDHDIDALVLGVGTGGTLTGLGRYFRGVQPDIEVVLADPVGSILVDYVETGELIEPGAWLVEGIGEDDLPPIGDLSLIDKAYRVSDAESFAAARELVRKEGVLGGSSTGTLVSAALRYCREQSEPKRVVVIIPDRGDKYLSKMYNDYWMLDQGFVKREQEGNLCDLIARRHEGHEDFTVTPDDTLLAAYGRMKLYNVSQLPVFEDGAIVGIIDEMDLLSAVFGHERDFAKPLRDSMTTRLETLQCSAPLGDLVALLRDGYVALIFQGDAYRGLVTRIDLLNYLRRRAQ
ncbi:MAG: pyridoxal-phosphate dependent enzyme [Alphaproteobacteria bacterium]|nr:pyridoxal-phosphate dependent enzyme [Alphaproteobacteria bacterium]